MPNLTNTHFGAVLERVQNTANASGYIVRTATASNDPVRDLQFVDSFQKPKLGGIILIGSGFEPDYVQALVRNDIHHHLWPETSEA